MDTDDENHFEYALGFAIVRRWGDLSRETQQLLFDEATAGDDNRTYIKRAVVARLGRDGPTNLGPPALNRASNRFRATAFRCSAGWRGR